MYNIVPLQIKRTSIVKNAKEPDNESQAFFIGKTSFKTNKIELLNKVTTLLCDVIL